MQFLYKILLRILTFSISFYNLFDTKQSPTLFKQPERVTLREEKTSGGTVKIRRFDPPVNMCFLTVDIICKPVERLKGSQTHPCRSFMEEGNIHMIARQKVAV